MATSSTPPCLGDDLFELIIARGSHHERYGRYDPWDDLARRTGVDLAWATHLGVPTTPNACGITDFSELRISLKVGMHETELRSTLAHELAHLDRGPTTSDEIARDERAADLLAATRIVDPVVFDALMARYDGKPRMFPVYHALGVDRELFEVYRSWRRRVNPTTAMRRWEEALQPTPWPAPWMRRYADEWPRMARAAGLASPTNTTPQADNHRG